MSTSHWTHGRCSRKLDDMTTTGTQTRTVTTDVSATDMSATDMSATEATGNEATAPTAAAPARVGRLSAFRAAVRTRRAQRSELSRQIAAYPATRSAAITVLPSSQGITGFTNRF